MSILAYDYSFRDIDEADYVPVLSCTQKFMLHLFDRIALDHRIYAGWKVYRTFYAFRCEKHGYVANCVRGYNERLECPICARIARDDLKK